jgi:hypothetical protein
MPKTITPLYKENISEYEGQSLPPNRIGERFLQPTTWMVYLIATWWV